MDDLVDYVLPLLPPYQFALYALLLRLTRRTPGFDSVRVGIRTIGKALGKGSRASSSNYQHIGEQLRYLEAQGFIAIGAKNREGTEYIVRVPMAVPVIQEARAALGRAEPRAQDWYADSSLRQQLFERDQWMCRYCGERLEARTVTLDHVVPVSLGGTNTPENLATCCLMCNSLKAGRTYEEAAPRILESLRQRRAR